MERPRVFARTSCGYNYQDLILEVFVGQGSEVGRDDIDGHKMRPKSDRVYPYALNFPSFQNTALTIALIFST